MIPLTAQVDYLLFLAYIYSALAKLAGSKLHTQGLYQLWMNHSFFWSKVYNIFSTVQFESASENLLLVYSPTYLFGVNKGPPVFFP